MLALVVFGTAAVLLGLLAWVPGVFGADTGITSVEPGRLIVEPSARGTVTLGDGYTISLFQSGFRYARDDTTMAETVTEGSPVIGLVGSVAVAGNGDGAREELTAHLGRVHVKALQITAGMATWTGEVSGELQGRKVTFPITWKVRLEGASIVTTVTADGAEGIVVPFDWRPAVVGVAPALPDRNLRLKGWWVAPRAGADATFTWVLGTTVGVGPAEVPRALDLTVDGRVDVHVWSSTATFVLTGEPRARQAPTS